MSTSVDRPPTATEEQPPPAADHQPEPAKRTIEERSWLLFACVVAFIVLAFAGMIVLTALGGGTDYVR